MPGGVQLDSIGMRELVDLFFEGKALPEDSPEEYREKRGDHYDPEKIGAIYQQVGYWHGTGALKYGCDRYDGGEHLVDSEIVEVLRSILRGGLLPHFDPLNDYFETGRNETLSISSQRMYASLYAKNYMQCDHELEFEYGNPYTWWLRYFIGMITASVGTYSFWAVTTKTLLAKAWYRFRKKYLPKMGSEESDKKWENIDLYRWMRYLNNEFTPLDSEDRVEVSFDCLRVIAGLRSSIQGNFPVLIGIARENLDLLPTDKRMLKAFESRIAHNVRKFTHIEVPLARIEEVRNLIAEVAPDLNGLPIIPFEDGELFCATEMSMAEHLEPDVEERS